MHVSKFDQLGTRNCRDLVVKSNFPSFSASVALRQVNPFHEKGVIKFLSNECCFRPHSVVTKDGLT